MIVPPGRFCVSAEPSAAGNPHDLRQDGEMEQTVDEMRHLQGCNNDLISSQALPAMWTGQEPAQIISTLLDVLIGMLRLDFAHGRLKAPVGGAPLEILRLAQSRNLMASPQEIGHLLKPCLEDDRQKWPLLVRNPIGDGDVSIVPLRLGLRDEIGVIVAGSQRADFPGETERLLLRVAANQAAIGLQEARLLSEQKRVARELDQRVAQRTEELAAANEALRQDEAELRRITDAIPQLIVVRGPDGAFLYANPSMFEEIVGSSPALPRVLAQMAKVAKTDSTVLILGETGTGKELVARAIHRRSDRSTRAFIRVNCAAIPPSLIASELFGHEKGAFTGATQRRLVRFESANGGTIFLDEIGDLPADIQIALLRVLQQREIAPIGASKPIPVDVRIP